MSERLYAWLLHLFPAAFRQAYGQAALQLFRDRARDEKGFFPTLRLWLDLLGDLAISIPREYRYARPALDAAFQHHLQGAPSFFVLGEELPGTGSLILGSALSMLALGLLFIALAQPGTHRSLTPSTGQRRYSRDSRPSTVRQQTANATAQAANARGLPLESRSAPTSTTDMTGSTMEETDPIASQPTESSNAVPPADNSKSSRHEYPPLPLESRTGVASAKDEGSNFSAPVDRAKLSAAERHRLLNAVIQNVNKHYFDPKIARKIANALVAHQRNGDQNAATDGAAYADLLTRQIRDVSRDPHLEVIYSQDPLPVQPVGPTPESQARYRQTLLQQNCMFRKVELLPHNIGYLKLDSFPDTSVCQATAVAAMASLNNADALIFDLRDNAGGFASMVLLLSSYLFDHPQYVYDPREGPTQQSRTLSPVAGNKLADKPVYILTSATTVSAAEQFCYNLKMLKRATLVGETTRGSAHSGVFHRIDDHFGMGIPEVKTVNPYSQPDWEGTGVEPDVKVNAAAALETAIKLAESKLAKKM
jgi:hypothetical protein